MCSLTLGEKDPYSLSHPQAQAPAELTFAAVQRGCCVETNCMTNPRSAVCRNITRMVDMDADAVLQLSSARAES